MSLCIHIFSFKQLMEAALAMKFSLVVERKCLREKKSKAFPFAHCTFFLTLSPNHEFCLSIFFLKLYFLNLTIWNSSICALISIDRTSDKILAILKKVTRWRYRSEFFKSKTKTNISPLQMRSQGCPVQGIIISGTLC